MLQNCLISRKLDVRSHEEMEASCIEAYGKPPKQCRGTIFDHEENYGDTPYLLFYPVDEIGSHMPPVAVTQAEIYNKGSDTE
jgi:hypothetical protein